MDKKEGKILQKRGSEKRARGAFGFFVRRRLGHKEITGRKR